MNTNVCFATQGELLKFAYDAFGVLPRKNKVAGDFDDESKKKIQKQLERLVKEEGHLAANYGEAVQLLSYILTGYLPSIRIVGAIGESLADLDDAYNALVRNEGTFLEKTRTLQYFISIKAVRLLVVSLNRSLLHYRIADFELETPEDAFWYLPSIADDGKLTLPLEKVMRWAYQRCGSSQTQFHYPGKNAATEIAPLQNHLDNAINWTRDAAFPALPALMKNFNDSFCTLAEHGREVPAQLQASILTALVVARVTTYVAKEIVQVYDAHYLKDVCTQFRSYSDWIAEDINEFKAEIYPVIHRQTSPDVAMQVWQHACSQYWEFFHGKLDAVVDTLERLKEARPDQPIRQDVLSALTSKYGPFVVHSCMDIYQRKLLLNAPQGFADMLEQGFALKRDSGTQWSQIDEYAEQVEACEMQEHLCWMEPWLRAVYHYRQEDFKAAMDFYQAAFDNAKYRCGRLQYSLVNQYVEVAAKNGKWQCFKKGVEWARYLGIQVRWLRHDEPTQENLEYVYAMLRVARYDHQL
ncbi:hypothetical protein FEM54_27010 [Pseudomonas edaphica]|uniref:Tetratricopeptide repeat protein n=1 Tax=Pseudomonas edaphica TaxID=2006980 RepID=A0ABY2TYC1_9PSED|nr:hypothetical protein [Pseudomonas edaphica]TLG88289.1 hypothetical protein FEM54_27010 [Pseudomonas edaphica]